MDRTVSALFSYSKRRIDTDEKMKNWRERNTKEHQQAGSASMSRPQNPGCEVSGHLMVNRVPGNFHLEAGSKSHSMNPVMANLTHRVHHLSFGDPLPEFSRKYKRILKQVPEEHKQFNPLDGQLFSGSPLRPRRCPVRIRRRSDRPRGCVLWATALRPAP